MLIASASLAIAGNPPSQADLQVIYKALDLKKNGGKLIDSCGENVQPEVEAVDLNKDGKPELFVTVNGSCYGVAGGELSLFIKDKNGRWQRNLGFTAGGYNVLSTSNRGYPDIEIGGPGFCFPVWRWNGTEYAIHKRCDR